MNNITGWLTLFISAMTFGALMSHSGAQSSRSLDIMTTVWKIEKAVEKCR